MCCDIWWPQIEMLENFVKFSNLLVERGKMCKIEFGTESKIEGEREREREREREIVKLELSLRTKEVIDFRR